MIESREKRKARTLLHRRKIAIILSLIAVVVLIVASALIYNRFGTSYYYTDVDGLKYEVREVDGLFRMFDPDGNQMTLKNPPNSVREHYETIAGSWVELDEETGEYQINAIPALYYEADGEMLDHLMLTVFKGIDKENVRSVEVSNSHGSFTLIRYNTETLKQDDSAGFVLKSSPFTTLKDDMLTYLVFYASNTVVDERIENPIKDANGEYSEYGLVAQTRYKEVDGEQVTYEYKPAVITTTSVTGEKHTLVIGDRLIDGQGYYLQYINGDGVKRDAVYVYNPTVVAELVEADITNSLLGSASELVEPAILYPSTQNDYFDVSNFRVNEKQTDGSYLKKLDCSYVDSVSREDTLRQYQSYVFNEAQYRNYLPNYTYIDGALMCLLDPQIEKIAVLSPTWEDRVQYGIMSKSVAEDGTASYKYDSKYVVSFDKPITLAAAETGKKEDIEFTIHQTMYISEPNEDGNYYVFSEISTVDMPKDYNLHLSIDMICEVAAKSVNFVTFDIDKWVYPSFMELAIAYTTKIEILSPSYNVLFNISRPTMITQKTMQIEASDSNGKYDFYSSNMEFYDTDGYRWHITGETVKMYDANGKEYKPSTVRWEDNSYGDRVQCINHYAIREDGALVYIEPDYIRIKPANGGEMQTIWRCQGTAFSNLFLTIIKTAIIGTETMTSEEEAALIGNPDNHQMTIKITDNEGTTRTFSFYKLTTRKSYITVDGAGGFYIHTSRLTKILNDVEKYMSDEDILIHSNEFK